MFYHLIDPTNCLQKKRGIHFHEAEANLWIKEEQLGQSGWSLLDLAAALFDALFALSSLI